MEPTVPVLPLPHPSSSQDLKPGSEIPSGLSGAPASETGPGCGGHSSSGLWPPAGPAGPSPLGSLAGWERGWEAVTWCPNSNNNHNSPLSQHVLGVICVLSEEHLIWSRPLEVGSSASPLEMQSGGWWGESPWLGTAGKGGVGVNPAAPLGAEPSALSAAHTQTHAVAARVPRVPGTSWVWTAG